MAAPSRVLPQLLLPSHASTIRTWVPPEGHASPHPDRRLHAAAPPVFHVALLAHHTADQRSGHVPVGGTTRIERSSKFRFPGWLVSLALATMNSHILQVQYSHPNVGPACVPVLKHAPSPSARMSLLQARAGCDKTIEILMLCLSPSRGFFEVCHSLALPDCLLQEQRSRGGSSTRCC